MQPIIIISILVFGLIIVGALTLLILTLRKGDDDSAVTDQATHPKGYWISIGISIGAGFGVALGLVFDNLALGIAIGAGVGVSIGAALEQKNKDNLRQPTEQEQKMQKWGVAVGLLILLVSVGLFMILLLLNR
ncbi:MAG: hypothetical protein ACK2U1_09485 [Anaerolineales bacterium]|jgi:uncharacterized membrane protein SpoIIM required for sporulation